MKEFCQGKAIQYGLNANLTGAHSSRVWLISDSIPYYFHINSLWKQYYRVTAILYSLVHNTESMGQICFKLTVFKNSPPQCMKIPDLNKIFNTSAVANLFFVYMYLTPPFWWPRVAWHTRTDSRLPSPCVYSRHCLPPRQRAAKTITVNYQWIAFSRCYKRWLKQIKSHETITFMTYVVKYHLVPESILEFLTTVDKWR